MTRELGKLKKFITIFAISVLLLPLLFSLLAAASVVAAPIIALDAAKTWIVGWFEDENTATNLLSKWHAEVYPNFEDYGSYEEVGYAEAISCYYFLETGEDINTKIPMREYMNYFTGDEQLEQVYTKIEEITGFIFSEEKISRIKTLKTQIVSKTINSMLLGRSELVAAPIEAAIEWGTAIANDNSHGYSQITRYGNPNYDCSSLVCYAMQAAGFNIAITSTHSMKNMFLAEGHWEWIPSYQLGDLSNYGVLSGQSSLRRGDILLNEQNHTELYLGGGMSLGAHWDWDGVNGDSSGTEISVAQYWDSNWDGILRYTGS